MSEPKSPAATEKELRDAFKKFDRDGNGTISSEEFTAIVTRPGGGKPLTIDQAARLFRRADLNGDGVVDYGEFCKSWGVIRGGGDSPKLADLQHPDAKHLMLGINLEGLREACELVGFKYLSYKDGIKSDAWNNTYNRKDHPEMAWLDKAYPDSMALYPDDRPSLGYDFCFAVKTWLKANGHENESICQVLLKRGSKNVGRANVFYSHIQGVWLPETIRRMREGIEAHKDQLPSTDESQLFFWLDYTTLKQAKKGGDFDLARVRQLVKEIGLVLAELDFDLQAYLTRSFCILEIFAAVDAGATLLVQMHFLKAFDVTAELAARPVDAKAAQTRSLEAKATIDGFVEAMPGGFETLNATVTEAIKKAAVPIAKQFSASDIFLQKPTFQKKGLTAHDATAVAELLKSNTSVTKVGLNLNREIGDEGAKALAEALKVNTTVKRIYLENCGIGNDGAAAFAEALRSNTSLTQLWLQDNRGIGKRGKQLLRDAVAARQGFDLAI